VKGIGLQRVDRELDMFTMTAFFKGLDSVLNEFKAYI